MNDIEVERRALLDRAEYCRIMEFLEKNAQSMGQDDKDCYFYIFPDKLLKVVNEFSQQRAKIVLKDNNIANSSSLMETEIFMKPAYFESANQIFSKLNLTQNIMHSFQERYNYNYLETEVALKYSDVWGYHLEIEKMVTKRDHAKVAENLINEVAKTLGVKLMSDQEVKSFTDLAESGYLRGLEQKNQAKA